MARRLHLPVDVALTELVGHANRWDTDRHGAAEARIHEVRTLHDRIAAQDQLPNTQRWAPLARQINPRLVSAATWPPLADAFAEASRGGHDLPTLLRHVLAQGRLDPGNPSLDLQSRLLADLNTEPQEVRHPHSDNHDHRTHYVSPYAVPQPTRRPAPPVTRDRPGHNSSPSR